MPSAHVTSAVVETSWSRATVRWMRAQVSAKLTGAALHEGGASAIMNGRRSFDPQWALSSTSEVGMTSPSRTEMRYWQPLAESETANEVGTVPSREQRLNRM